MGSLGHVGYVADIRNSNGVLQIKVYDRNADGRGGNREGVWVNRISSMRFITAPPRASTRLR
jgi:hypothetical protein